MLNIAQVAKKGGRKASAPPTPILLKDAIQGSAVLPNPSISLYIFLILALPTLVADSVYKPQDYQTASHPASWEQVLWFPYQS